MIRYGIPYEIRLCIGIPRFLLVNLPTDEYSRIFPSVCCAGGQNFEQNDGLEKVKGGLKEVIGEIGVHCVPTDEKLIPEWIAFDVSGDGKLRGCADLERIQICDR